MQAVNYELQDLTCALCQDIYNSPRFMKECYHSFCQDCLDGLAEAGKSNVIACPICRKKTTLPEGGASLLQSNFHYRDEKLAEARRLVNKKCVRHEDKDVDRVCLKCECALCEECTGHGKGHGVHMISQLLDGLEKQTQQMEELLNSKMILDSALEKRVAALSNQLGHQADLLHGRVDRQFKFADSRQWSITQNGSKRLNKQIAYLLEEGKKSRNLLDQGKERWGNGAKVSDILDSAEKVVLQLDKDVDLLSPVTTDPVPHPGLICDTKDVKHALTDFLGQPVQHTPPEEAFPLATFAEHAIIPVNVRHPKKVREILGVIFSTDQTQVMICFRGNPCYLFSSVAVVQLEEDSTTGGVNFTTVAVDYDVFQGKVVCYFGQCGKSECCPVLLRLSHTVGVIQISKGTPRMCLCRDEAGNTQLHHLGRVKLELKEQTLGWKVPLVQPKTGSLVMPVDVANPFNMDVSPDEQYCVIIDNGKDSSQIGSPQKKKRKLEEGMSEDQLKCIQQPKHGAMVKLFRKGESEPIDIYRPSESTFVPSDVCFCRWEKHQLLIADWQNDKIHVVFVGENGFTFKYLAAEHLSELVKPTALNTDTDCWVFVGCSNGTLLSWSMKSET